MRTLLPLLAFALLCALPLSAQNVPDVVKKSFQLKFPDATDVEWDAEEDGFEAEFDAADGAEMSAMFSTDGEWLSTETEIGIDVLPRAVMKGMQTHFPGGEIKQAETVEMPGKPMAYEVEFIYEGDTVEALFSAEGELVKHETEGTDEDGEDED